MTKLDILFMWLTLSSCTLLQFMTKVVSIGEWNFIIRYFKGLSLLLVTFYDILKALFGTNSDLLFKFLFYAQSKGKIVTLWPEYWLTKPDNTLTKYFKLLLNVTKIDLLYVNAVAQILAEWSFKGKSTVGSFFANLVSIWEWNLIIRYFKGFSLLLVTFYDILKHYLGLILTYFLYFCFTPSQRA